MSDCGKVADEIKAIYDFCKRNRAAICMSTSFEGF
jgi:hypothetical protein